MDWSLSQYVRDLGETEELQVLHHQQKRRKLFDQVKYLFDVSIRYLRMVPIQCWSNFSGMEHQKSNYSQSDTWAQMLNWTSRHPENKDTASDSPRYVGGEIGLILVSVNSPRWSIGIDIGHKKKGIKPTLVSLQGSPKSCPEQNFTFMLTLTFEDMSYVASVPGLPSSGKAPRH